MFGVEVPEEQLGWADTTKGDLSTRMRIPRNYSQKYPHSWRSSHPAPTCLGNTNPTHSEHQEFCCFRPKYSRICGEGMGKSIQKKGFWWIFVVAFLAFHPQLSQGISLEFLGISLEFQPIPARSMPFPALGFENGIFRKIKFTAGAEGMNLVLNPGKQGEPTWRFILGIPGLFPGIRPALSAHAFQAQ